MLIDGPQPSMDTSTGCSMDKNLMALDWNSPITCGVQSGSSAPASVGSSGHDDGGASSIS
jgi:hypothetical protein